MLTSRQLDTLHRYSVKTLMGLGFIGFGLSMVAAKELVWGPKQSDKEQQTSAATETSSEELKG